MKSVDARVNSDSDYYAAWKTKNGERKKASGI
jgi:hypothetical protein